jgi:hypothetical protein
MKRSLVFRILLAATVAAGLLPAAAVHAGSLAGEQIYEDSFGNLVVHSPAGYKRIVVGMGYLADDLNASAEAGPAVVLYEEAPREYRRAFRDPHCNRQPVLLKGRSYMYGLPDNVVPVPAGLCR